MTGRGHNLITLVTIAALAAVIGACSSDPIGSLSGVNLLPTVNQFAKPDWLTYSGGKEQFTLRAVGPDDLIGPEGQCTVTAEQAAAQTAAAATVGEASRVAGAPREGLTDQPQQQQTPLLQGGIALQMTECDVVRRAGAPERVEFGTGQRGERTVVLTYIRGQRPGVYRFAGGRLYSIERAPEPPPQAKQKKSRPKKKSPRA
ncbi:MAG: hypothetical protein ACRECO_10540 [Xanthobacteraceae bacterium]